MAGFTYLQDTRVVQALAASSEGAGDGDSQSSAAPEFQRQSQLDAEASFPFEGGDNIARASQTSSLVDVSFQVDETTAFSIDALATFTQRNSSNEDRGRLTLKRLIGDQEETLTTFALTIDDLTDNDGVAFNASGDFTPGRYRIQFDLFARASADEGADVGSYEFTLDPDATLNGGTPIPLPPAAWAGLLTFACYGGSRLLGRRLRRA